MPPALPYVSAVPLPKFVGSGRLLWECNTVERETIEILRLSDGKFVEH